MTFIGIVGIVNKKSGDDDDDEAQTLFLGSRCGSQAIPVL